MLNTRHSIAHLMILIAFLGTGAASLLNASRLWAGIIPMLTTMLLLASILGVIYRSGESRAAWTGFAVFGSGFVLLSLFGNSIQAQ
jgi:dolichol kinase